jgi:hypothetical protein
VIAFIKDIELSLGVAHYSMADLVKCFEALVATAHREHRVSTP